MKPIALDINVVCAAAHKSYGAIVEQEHFQDAVAHSDYLEQHRSAITQNFMALCLLDCSNLIVKELGGIIDAAETTDN